MRVVAGILRGRNFRSPRTRRTHPMSDRMRGALFNTLGDIKDLTVLDAFAGTGAIAIESVSRGARHATAIERDKSAYQTLVDNIVSLGCEQQIKATCANVTSWSSMNRDVEFDIVICDPPYNKPQHKALIKLARHLATDGTYVLSLPAAEEPLEIIGLRLIKTQKHAGGSLHYYKQA
jgi:16S rRNA (guanine966-N2)-methyltransferase